MGAPVEATDAGAALYATYTLSEYLALPVDMWENVRPLHYRAALATLRPDCVLCSWMPPDEDWTPEIRATESVREYVLFWELRGTTGGPERLRAEPRLAAARPGRRRGPTWSAGPTTACRTSA